MMELKFDQNLNYPRLFVVELQDKKFVWWESVNFLANILPFKKNCDLNADINRNYFVKFQHKIIFKFSW